jgi:alkanesulfonate monooxygenase SsuD/methylene tetrahydromethanopterin reductase-like flavin-dependent oxidoreductase (luciferase family)
MLRAFDVVPQDKRSLFETRLQCMRLAWTGMPVGEGAEAGVLVHPRPVQQPHPPIWVAAFGPKALDQAGRLGLPYLASPVETLDMLLANYARHRAALVAAGQAEPDVVPIMRTLFVTGSAVETRTVRAVLTEQARRLGRLPPEADVDAWSVVGEAGYVRERVDEYRSRLGMTHLIAARPRFGGIEPERLEQSMTRAAEILRS